MKKRAKRNLTMKLLEFADEAVAKVKHWPQKEGDFAHASVALAKAVSNAVIDHTWDASHMSDWEWDAYDQCFTFYVQSSFRMGGEITSRPVEVKSRFRFFPKKGLSKELDRVIAEVEQYANNLLFMQRAYHEARKRGDVTSLEDDRH